MASRTCYRCHGNAFLERLTPQDAAWVCLQCGARRYIRSEEILAQRELDRVAERA